MTTKLDELKALMAAVPQGPYFVGDDVAHDTIPHADSGLAMVDTGRESDWPVARLCEWGYARLICASLNSLPTLIAAVEALEQSREDINWMLNNWTFLNADTFDYIDAALAALERTEMRRHPDCETLLEQCLNKHHSGIACKHECMALVTERPDNAAGQARFTREAAIVSSVPAAPIPPTEDTNENDKA